MTQQNAAMVEESTAAARSLATEASHLTGLVSRFILDGQPAQKSEQHRETPRMNPSRPRSRHRPAARTNLAIVHDAGMSEDWTDF